MNENHIVNQILYLDDKQKWRKLLDKKVEELKKSSNFGSQNKVVLGKIQHILDKINADDNARVIRGQLNIIYWHKEPNKLEANSFPRLRRNSRNWILSPYYPRGEERKNYFLNSYCAFSSNFSNEDLYVTDLKHALCLLINNTNYKSDETGIIFNDREYNVPVSERCLGRAKETHQGYGTLPFSHLQVRAKSFLANNILRQYFESGVRLVIIDLGGILHEVRQTLSRTIHCTPI